MKFEYFVKKLRINSIETDNYSSYYRIFHINSMYLYEFN